MVFSPQSAPPLDLPKVPSPAKNAIKTEPESSEKDKQILPTKISSNAVNSGSKDLKSDTLNAKAQLSSLDTKKAENTISYVENNLFNPEYDNLSRQPAQFAEEKFRVVDNNKNGRERTSSNQKRAHEIKNTESNDATVVKSSIVSANHPQGAKLKKPAIRPSSSLRILKTASPETPKVSLSPTKTSHRAPPASNRPRKTHKNKTPHEKHTASSPPEPTTEGSSPKKGRSRSKSKRKHKNSFTSDISATKVDSHPNRKSSRFKLQPSPVETGASTSLYMFKLNRTPGRWQYKTSPKPRVNIRKSSNDNVYANDSLISTASLNDGNGLNQNTVLENSDLESLGSQSGAVLNNLEQENKERLFAETLNVDISTPSDFKSTYFEIATIKTPYIFQAGNVKKTRFLTVTSTIEKTVSTEPTVALKEGEPLIENILATSDSSEYLQLESSIKTLSPLRFSSEYETPSLKTVVETFTSTTRKLKTQVLPLIRDDLNETSFITLVQTYDLATMITATKTLSPVDEQFDASKNFKDFSGLLDEAGSEINLELEFGDTDNSEYASSDRDLVDLHAPNQQEKRVKPEHAPNSVKDELTKQISIPNIFNPMEQMSTVLTTSQPYIVMETVWDTYVVPVTNGKSTNYRTLSKSVGSFEKTQFRVDTTTVLLPPIATPQINPYLIPQLQQFQTISSPIVHQTLATQTSSKILKLTFGAKTAYTTIFSTNVVPTQVTTFITTSLPVQPSAAFPPFFPAPYNPFQFVG